MSSINSLLYLLFPQWQGSGCIELYQGALRLHQRLQSRIEFVAVPVVSTYSLALEQNILGYRQILEQVAQASTLIQQHNPDRIFTLGGDCGVEIAPVSFLNQKYDGEIAVIWLDAHSDLNTPESSPSAHFHGMPLRVLLGEGDAGILSRRFAALHPDQIFLVGAREFDRPEQEFVAARRLAVFSVQEIEQMAQTQFHKLITAIERLGYRKIYIHLDLDVLNPQDFPHVACPAPGGFSVSLLEQLLQTLHAAFDVIGLSVLEFFPRPSEVSAVDQLIQALHHLSWFEEAFVSAELTKRE